jgi:hypothetical protein
MCSIYYLSENGAFDYTQAEPSQHSFVHYSTTMSSEHPCNPPIPMIMPIIILVVSSST